MTSACTLCFRSVTGSDGDVKILVPGLGCVCRECAAGLPDDVSPEIADGRALRRHVATRGRRQAGNVGTTDRRWITLAEARSAA